MCAVNLLIWHCVCIKAKPLKQHLSLAHPVAVKCTNNSNSKINKWAIDFPECSGLLIGRPAVRADTFFIKKNWITDASLLLSLFLTHSSIHNHTTENRYQIYNFFVLFISLSLFFYYYFLLVQSFSHYADHLRLETSGSQGSHFLSLPSGCRNDIYYRKPISTSE